MSINSHTCTISSVFNTANSSNVFHVPKYQRGYAWKKEDIVTFKNDLEHCLNKCEENSGKPHMHFFGGIITSKLESTDKNNQHFEIIDGQQRLTTFVMLIKIIVFYQENMLNYINSTESIDESIKIKYNNIISDQINCLCSNYMYYGEIDIDKKLYRLNLSHLDDDFFKQLLENNEIDEFNVELLPSQQKIYDAWIILSKFVETLCSRQENYDERINILKKLTDIVLTEHCRVVSIVTDQRSEVFQLFQVVNDRGVRLSNGDILRANSIDSLDEFRKNKLQDKLAVYWDHILIYEDKHINDYLKWYFASHVGRFPDNKIDFPEQFMEKLFDLQKFEKVSKSDEGKANFICKVAKNIADEFRLLEILRLGKWPFNENSKASAWEKQRLSFLINYLDNTSSLPLILAMTKKNEQDFSKFIFILEKFFFRYKTIGGMHIGTAQNLFCKHSKLIRSRIDYPIKDLYKDLKNLVNKKVSDELFRMKLKELANHDTNRRILRYVLLNIEYLGKDPKNEHGKPLVFELDELNSEHIYPKKPKQISAELERIKHNLGNMTLLHPNDNSDIGNEPFNIKKSSIFKHSEFRINRELDSFEEWTISEFNLREKNLLNSALSIFDPENWNF